MRLLAMWTNVTSHPHTWFFSHPWEMGLLASSLLHHQGYSSPFGVPTGPTAFIAPGYPTIIAGIFAIFGIATFASALVIIGMHIMLALLTIWIVMHLAGSLFGRNAAIVAGTFWALSPPLWFIPAIFWETSFSAAFIVGAVALALYLRDRITVNTWIGFGAACALMSLINPALLFSLLAIIGWLAWQTRERSWRGPVLGLLTLLVVFSPWPIRNAYRFHAFIPLRSTVGFELWMGNRPGAKGRLDESIFPMFNKQELTSYMQQGEVAYVQSKSDLAWSFIRSNPGWFANMTARRIVRFWGGTGNTDTSPVFVVHALLTTCFRLCGPCTCMAAGLSYLRHAGHTSDTALPCPLLHHSRGVSIQAQYRSFDDGIRSVRSDASGGTRSPAAFQPSRGLVGHTCSYHTLAAVSLILRQLKTVTAIGFCFI